MSDDLNEPVAPEPELVGADYRAVTRLSNAEDETLAEVGETCERVPVASLPWLLRDGLIEPVTPPEPPPHRRADDRKGGD